MQTQTQKFVGPKKVDHVVIDDLKTFGNNDVVVVHYEGGATELMPKRTFELVATEESSDYTTIRTKKFGELKKDIYPIFGQYVSKLGLEQSIKDEAKTKMLQDSLAAISEIDIKDEEMEPLFNQIQVEFQGIGNAVLYELCNATGRAVNLLWTGKDELFVPGGNAIASTTFLEAKKIVEKFKNVESKTTAE
jgi:hypothetical protein